jgi:hypothetical protein
MGLINHLWQNYFSYYSADYNAAKTPNAYARNATKSSDFILSSYGFDNKSTEPFFNNIKIYQMARHEYVCYTLINPIVSSWSNKKVSYSEATARDFDMKLKYEAVAYSEGKITEGDPIGFASEHYDNTPSPLIGTIDNARGGPSFSQKVDLQGLGTGILNNTISTVNGYQNTPTPNGANATSGLLDLSVVQSTSGLGAQGITIVGV